LVFVGREGPADQTHRRNKIMVYFFAVFAGGQKMDEYVDGPTADFLATRYNGSVVTIPVEEHDARTLDKISAGIMAANAAEGFGYNPPDMKVPALVIA